MQNYSWLMPTWTRSWLRQLHQPREQRRTAPFWRQINSSVLF